MLPELKKQLDRILAAGKATDEDLPLLRGCAKSPPDGDVSASLRCLALLAPHDDPRDLALSLAKLIKKVGADAVRSVWGSSPVQGPLRGMGDRMLRSGGLAPEQDKRKPTPPALGVKTHGAPPRPGLVFDESRHRWVRPKNSTSSTGQTQQVDSQPYQQLFDKVIEWKKAVEAAKQTGDWNNAVQLLNELDKLRASLDYEEGDRVYLSALASFEAKEETPSTKKEETPSTKAGIPRYGRSFQDIQTADQILLRAYHSQSKRMTKEELRAIEIYSADWGPTTDSSLNPALREGTRLTPKQKQAIHLIDSALKKSQIPFDLRVYRGVELPVGTFAPGKVVTDFGYMNTTIDPEISTIYGGGGIKEEGVENYLLHIDLPKGTHAFYIKAAGANEFNEDEFALLLPRSTSLRVISTTKDSNGIIQVHAKIDKDKASSRQKKLTPPALGQKGLKGAMTEANRVAKVWASRFGERFGLWAKELAGALGLSLQELHELNRRLGGHYGDGWDTNTVSGYRIEAGDRLWALIKKQLNRSTGQKRLTKGLSDKQRRALEYVQILIDKQRRDILENDPAAKPSEWLVVARLKPLGITQADIDKLVRDGYLERRASDGSGPEVRRKSIQFKDRGQPCKQGEHGDGCITREGSVSGSPGFDRSGTSTAPPEPPSAQATHERQQAAAQETPEQKLVREQRARLEYAKVGVRSKAFKDWFGDWEADPSKASKVVDHATGEPAKTTHGELKEQHIDGRPLLVFHGTPFGDIDRFDPSRIKDPDNLVYGPGIYFTEGEPEARHYSDPEEHKLRYGETESKPRVLKAYLNIRDPFDIDRMELKSTDLPEKERAILRSAVLQYTVANLGTSEARETAKEFDRGELTYSYSELANSYGISKTAINAAVQRLGHDGLTVQSKDKRFGFRHWVIFRPNQAKAVDNLGTFDPTTDQLSKSIMTKGRGQSCKRGEHSDGCITREGRASEGAGGSGPSAAIQASDGRPKLIYHGPMTAAKKTKLRKELKDKHGDDPDFHDLSNGLAFYAQGFFAPIRQVAAAINTGTVKEMEANAQGFFGEGLRSGEKNPTMMSTVMSTVTDYVFGEDSDRDKRLRTITYEGAKRYANLIQQGIEQAEPTEAPLYRGISVRKLPDLKPGDRFDIAEPTSWTRSRELGDKFSYGKVKGQTSEPSPRSIPLVISVEGPNKALDIDVFSPWHQQEALSNGRFVVQSYDKESRPARLVLKQVATVAPAGVSKSAVKYPVPTELAQDLTQTEYDEVRRIIDLGSRQVYGDNPAITPKVRKVLLKLGVEVI